MRKKIRTAYLLAGVVLCGMLQFGTAAKADTVIDARPAATTEKTTRAKATTEQMTEKQTESVSTQERKTESASTQQGKTEAKQQTTEAGAAKTTEASGKKNTVGSGTGQEEKLTEEGTTENTGDGKTGWNKKKTSYYEDGIKVTGVYEIDGDLYYFTPKGVLFKKKGLNTVEGKTYYFNTDHTLATGVVKADGVSYYFMKETGERLEQEGLRKADGKYYLVNEDFSLRTGWYRDQKGKRYYFHKKQFAALKGWNYVGKYKYYFNKKGQLQQDVRKKMKKKTSYMIRVNRTASCVTVYAKDGLKGYTIPVVAFVCSAGNDTPTGTFYTGIKHRWHELFGPCWGQWTTQITGNILFHSVYYDSYNDNKSLNVAAYNKLGTIASHGCVRLQAGAAKWIYDNCKAKTKVVIYNDKKNPGPFDKPVAQKLSSSHTWDPTDPAFRD